MKSYCKGLVIDRDFVAGAYAAWAQSQAGRKSLWRVPREHGGADALIDEIAREIEGRALGFRPIEYRERVEGTGCKVRLIGIEGVKQQVVEHVVIRAVDPLYKARLGPYQCAGVRGRGQEFAARAIRRWCDSGARWYVKADVRKCYQSTAHGVVMAYYKKYVRSPDVLYCIGALLATFREGLNLGGHFSLVTMNLLLAQAYHHVGGLGHRRRGKWRPLVAHQLWFMDDVLLMGTRKADVVSAARELERYLHEELGLTLKPWKVCAVSEGEPIDICAYVTRPGRTTVRARVFLRSRRAFSALARAPTARRARRAASYWGYLRHSDSFRHVRDHNIGHLMGVAGRLVAADDRRKHEGLVRG